MDTNATWFQFTLNVVLGAVSGGLTSDVSVRLLFRPRQPVLGLQGAIPKNKARLAKAVGKTLGEKLLTPADIARELDRPELRAAFDRVLVDAVTGLLDTELGAPRDILPPTLVAELERALGDVAERGADRFAGYAATEAFETRATALVARAREEIASHPVHAMLGGERRAALVAQAKKWVDALFDSGDLADGVRTWVTQRAGSLVGGSEGRLARAVGERLADGLLRALKGDSSRAFLVEKVEAALEGVLSRTWGELLQPLDDGAIARVAVDLARGPRARGMAAQALTSGLSGVLDRPIGRIGRWLPEDAPDRIAAAIAPPLWSWILSQAETVATHVDVPGIVERRINAFEPERVEQIVRGVAQRELNLIVLLGYVLGGLIGVVTWALVEWAKRA
ncbi:MAG: DUF445 family protein [Gemmatimonadetes bacterium]|nr:DUF445 family protein [Gemmatimonadota bacterium]